MSNEPADLGITSAEALAGAEQMAAMLRAGGWRVDPPGDTIPTGNGMSDERRTRICQWLRDNHLSPDDIPMDASIRVGRDTITTDVIVRGADGKPVISGNSVLRNRVTVPLIEPWREA